MQASSIHPDVFVDGSASRQACLDLELGDGSRAGPMVKSAHCLPGATPFEDRLLDHGTIPQDSFGTSWSGWPVGSILRLKRWRRSHRRASVARADRHTGLWRRALAKAALEVSGWGHPTGSLASSSSRLCDRRTYQPRLLHERVACHAAEPRNSTPMFDGDESLIERSRTTSASPGSSGYAATRGQCITDTSLLTAGDS